LYLQEARQFDWATMALQKGSDELSQQSGISHTLFSYRDAQQLAEVLNPEKYSSKDLQQFAEEEMEEDDPDIGELMIDAIKNFRQALLTLKESDILLLTIA
jgi:hypothetical protein